MDRVQKFVSLVETVHRLRAPGGCPWDRKQTHQSLRQYLIEEAYEVLDVLDEVDSAEKLKDDPRVRANLREELGDLLMQVLIHSEITREEGVFDIYDVAEGLNEKLVRRHPHVFGDVKAETADDALGTWEKQKAKEKAGKLEASVLDGVPKGLPALQRAVRVIEKVTKVGFQWPDLNGPVEKALEEVREFGEEMRAWEREKNGPQREEFLRRMESELGDVLFTLCNLASLTGLNPENALRAMLHRFESRFKHVERRVKEGGRALEETSLEEMDRYWEEAKARERSEEKTRGSR